MDIVPSTDSFDSNAPNLQVFSYATIKAATNNFLSKNKIGEGGFGPVYKVASMRNRRSLYKICNPTQNLYFILLSKVSVLQEYANDLVLFFLGYVKEGPANSSEKTFENFTPRP